MEKSYEAALHAKSDLLRESLVISPPFLSVLRDHLMLSESQLEKLKNMTAEEVFLKLKAMITSQGPVGYDTLKTALLVSNQTDIADELEEEESRLGIEKINANLFQNGGGCDDKPIGNTWIDVQRVTDTHLQQYWRELDKDTATVYAVNHSPRGRFVIFNNEYFWDKEKNRGGSMRDVENLFRLATQLEFSPFDMVKHNLTGQEMVDQLEEMSQWDFSGDDALIVAVLSHGARGVVCSVDDKYIEIEKMVELFDGQNCPTLSGKPKLFIIQACQKAKRTVPKPDGEWDESVCTSASDSQQSGDDEVWELRIPATADVMVAYATVEGYAAYRETGLGSWFIRSLVEVFSRHAHEEDLQALFTKVKDSVSGESSKRGWSQMPKTADTLRKKWFFLPGYRGDSMLPAKRRRVGGVDATEDQSCSSPGVTENLIQGTMKEAENRLRQRSAKEKNYTDVEGQVVSKSSVKKCVRVTIDVGPNQTRVTTFCEEKRFELENLESGKKYLFRHVKEQHPGGAGSYKYEVHCVYVYDKTSSVTVGKTEELQFTGLEQLMVKKLYESVNVKGFFLEIDKNPERRSAKVIAVAWFVSDGYKTYIDIYDAQHPVFNFKRGVPVEALDVTVLEHFVGENLVCHLGFKRSSTLTEVAGLSLKDIHSCQAEILTRSVDFLHSVQDLKRRGDKLRYYSFRALISNFKKPDSTRFQFLSCPSCKKEIKPEYENICVHCNKNADKKPIPSLLMNVTLRDVADESDTNSEWAVIFSSARFFDQLPKDLFQDELTEDKFLQLDEKVQIARIKKIIMKKYIFQFIVRLTDGNPVVLHIKRLGGNNAEKIGNKSQQ